MKLDEIKNPQDVYQFIDDNIEYGWIDINGNMHLNTMKDFRRIYRTMSIDEILKYRVGTCIDQVDLMNCFFIINFMKIVKKYFLFKLFMIICL